MGIGPSITNYFRESHGLSVINAKVVGAVIGGVISATLSHPIDTVKVCNSDIMTHATPSYYALPV